MLFTIQFEGSCNSCHSVRVISILEDASNYDTAEKRAEISAIHQNDYHYCHKCDPSDNHCSSCKPRMKGIESGSHIIKHESSLSFFNKVMSIRDSKIDIRQMMDLLGIDTDKMAADLQKSIKSLMERWKDKELTMDQREEISRAIHMIKHHQLNTEKCEFCS